MKKENEELKSRRDFFKKAAKSALPIIGAVVLANSPIVSKAAETAMGCGNYCSGGCYGACTGCGGGCANECVSGCKGTCRHTCAGSCGRTCGRGVVYE